MKKDILSMLPDELREDFIASGLPKFRAEQTISWLSKGVRNFGEMRNLPKDLISFLDDNYCLYKPEVISKSISELDGTVKYLWRLSDGNAVETVIMRYSYGNTVCVSSQVGCRQGCAFCASTIGGLVRCLSASEIYDEVFFSQADSGLKISNIVLMGIGEPLDNFDNVMKFIELVNCKEMLNIGMRHITLSTCGIIEKFDELAAKQFPITLTVSLHAPDDETRSKIMPANRNRGVEKLVDSCLKYYRTTGRRISFEYAMIRDTNDSDSQALMLAEHARRAHAHVNLIPLNYVKESSLLPSSEERIKRFKSILEENGINVTVRRRLGSDVNASCGQLRRKFLKNSIEE